MKSRVHRHPRIAAALATALGLPLAEAAAPPAPAPPAPDTSGWKCELCPFMQGHTGSVEGGVLYAEGADAAYGRYTGVDHGGPYADVAVSGLWRNAAGFYGGYSLDRLGLPSREAGIETGREGSYRLGVTYDGQPTRLYDTAVSPYLSPAAGQLILPGSWTAAGTTVSMTQLGSSLTPLDLGFERRTVGLSGEYLPGSSWTLHAELQHQEKKGTQIGGGAFLTDAVQLPQPVDYVTDRSEVSAAWAGAIVSVRLSYTGSWFRDNSGSLAWANPYLPVTPDATVGRLAQPPGNNLQQVAAAGEMRLPVFIATMLTYHFSYGWLSQDARFLPESTLPGAVTLSRDSLGGEVRLTHYALGLSSRPLSGLYVRGSAAYDGRDDHTLPLAIPQVLTDALANGIAVTPRYGEDRTRLEGSADYRVVSTLRLGIGGQFQNVRFSPGQVLSWLQDRRSWGQVTFTPLTSLGLTLKAGNASRRISDYHAVALPVGENLLLRAYNYAPRDTNFFSFRGSWSPLATLAWSVEGTWSDEAYRLTQLGLTQSRDRKISSTVTWTPAQKLSIYADGSYQRLSALQSGDIGNGAPQWLVQDAQHFWDVGAGGSWAIGQHWEVSAGYRRSFTRGNDTIWVSSLAEPFPENRYVLDSLSVSGTYKASNALRVRFHYQHERYATSDWALDGVGPDTVATLLALGVQPCRYTVNAAALTVQYSFDTTRSTTGQD